VKGRQKRKKMRKERLRRWRRRLMSSINSRLGNWLKSVFSVDSVTFLRLNEF
jgi:hypothetical protein